MRRRLLWIIFGVIVVVVGVGGASYYTYEQATYVTTNNAQVAVDMTTITAPSAGVLSQWSIQTGDTVTSSERVGQEWSYVAKSSIPKTTTTKGRTHGQTHASGSLPTGQPALVKSYTPFVIPAGGTVLLSNATQGQVVEASQPLAVVGDLSKQYVSAYVKETDIKHVSVGALADVTLDAVPGITFTGTVQRIGNTAGLVLNETAQLTQSSSSTEPTEWIPVRIKVNFQGQYVVPGMNATVKIHR